MSFPCRLGAFFAPLKVMGEREKELEALVDTGAFMTGVYMEDCIEIRAKPSGMRLVRGMFGTAFLPTFRCVIKVAGRVFNKDVLGLPKQGAILGRDLLEAFKITLDWKTETARVEDP